MEKTTAASSLKRAVDIVLSFTALEMLAPLMGLIALAIRITSAGPVFYFGLRVGRGGRTFRMIKFRTMAPGSDKAGPLVTSADDPRITRIGHFLRNTKLDELPTLLNVLKGDMSIVGPRPENPTSAALYTDKQKSIWAIRPGITSLATLKYRHEEKMLAGVTDFEPTYFQIMQDKLSLELDYVKRQSLRLDFQIILRTMVEVFR